MKKILFLALALVTIGLTSCSNEEKEVKKFVDNYAPQLASGGYDLEKDGDSYIATFDGDRRIILSKDDDGEWQCEKSYGLQQFDPELLGFAQRTGWVERKMDDASIAKRLENTEFLDIMTKRFVKELEKNITASMGGGSLYSFHDISASVNNRTDWDIPGDAYKVVFRFTFWAFPEDNETKALDGVDLPAHSSKSVKGTKRGTGEPTGQSVRVKFDEEQLPQLCLRIYNGTGHEYADYIAGTLR